MDDYSRRFSEIIPFLAETTRAELSYAFHKGLKQEIVTGLVSKIDLEADVWQTIRDKAADLDEVLFQQSRGARSSAGFPSKARTSDNKKTDNMDWSASVNAVTTSAKQPLTKEEREELIKNGGCFKCRQLGHKSFQCPELAAGNKKKQPMPKN